VKRVLLIPDVPGWAWDRRAQSLKKYADPERFEVDVKYEGDLSRNRKFHEGYDGVLQFSWTVAETGLAFSNYWGFVASAGCMWPYPIPDDAEYWERTASKEKNSVAAKHKMRRYSGIITVNKMCVEFCEQYCRRVVLLKTGVDLDLFRPTEPVRPTGLLRVGWCGKPSTQEKFSPKGYREILAPLMADVAKQTWGRQIVWNINTHTHADRLTTEQMVEWYNNIDVLLITSSIEGTPSVLLEAMACGRPAISTPVGIVRDVCNQQELPAVRTTAAYRSRRETQPVIRRTAAELEWMLEHRSENISLGAHARDVVERSFGWQGLADTWLETISDERCLTV
jgi:glycosyltransferase involved in cell wall biosynthesis